MNTITCFVMAVVVVAAADGGFNQQQSAPSAPDTYANYNNYNDYQQPPRQQSLLDRFSTNIRRQGLGGLGALGGIGPIIGIVVAVFVVVVFVVGFSIFFSQLTSSGRGLDTDSWEVNHSVWMDQLQNDFEDSWSVE